MSTQEPKTILPPRTAILQPSRNVKLWFPKGSTAPDGEYITRGAIAWPERHEDGVYGFALLAGRNTETGRIYIFDQRKFYAVRDILSEDGTRVEFPGVTSWFHQMWSTYFNDCYYHGQPSLHVRRYKLEVAKTMADEKLHPVFPRLEWDSFEHAAQVIPEMIATRQLSMKAGSPLHHAATAYKANPEVVPAAVYALITMVQGILRHPVGPGVR